MPAPCLGILMGFPMRLACVVLLLVLAACSGPATIELRGPTMGTTWSVKLVPTPGLDRAALERGIQAELDRVVAQMSTYEADSDLVRFNRAAAGSWQVLPPEFFGVLQHALDLARDTGGAYDPTVAPLVDLWGFGARGVRAEPPAAADIEAARARVGWQRLQFDPASRHLLQPGGLRLDLSSIAEGYAVDRMGLALEKLGVTGYLVEIGGELRARGSRPDGMPWRVAITGSRRITSSGSRPRSRRSSTSAVVPIFSAQAKGAMFESPISKCSRRYLR